MSVPDPVSFNSFNQMTGGLAGNTFELAAFSPVGMVTFGFIYLKAWVPWHQAPSTTWTPYY